MAKKRVHKEVKLKTETLIKVRFSEVDSMQVVWHGEYVKYFEDGREEFGRKYKGLGYKDFIDGVYLVPIVDLTVQFKRSLKYNDTAIVETKYIETEAAKICFEYVIRREEDGEIVATGTSTQVFLDVDGNLLLNAPEFYLNWKKRWLL